jgi:hypothetical protein
MSREHNVRVMQVGLGWRALCDNCEWIGPSRHRADNAAHDAGVHAGQPDGDGGVEAGSGAGSVARSADPSTPSQPDAPLRDLVRRAATLGWNEGRKFASDPDAPTRKRAIMAVVARVLGGDAA